MSHLISCAFSTMIVLLLAGAPVIGASSSNNPGNCKVVEMKPGEAGSSGSMSSSVTAGGGRVSGSTTGAGQSVTVHSGDGRTSSSVATAGSSGGSTVVAGSGSGDCVIYVDPAKKDDSK